MAFGKSLTEVTLADFLETPPEREGVKWPGGFGCHVHSAVTNARHMKYPIGHNDHQYRTSQAPEWYDKRTPKPVISTLTYNGTCTTCRTQICIEPLGSSTEKQYCKSVQGEPLYPYYHTPSITNYPHHYHVYDADVKAQTFRLECCQCQYGLRITVYDPVIPISLMTDLIDDNRELVLSTFPGSRDYDDHINDVYKALVKLLTAMTEQQGVMPFTLAGQDTLILSSMPRAREVLLALNCTEDGLERMLSPDMSNPALYSVILRAIATLEADIAKNDELAARSRSYYTPYTDPAANLNRMLNSTYDQRTNSIDYAAMECYQLIGAPRYSADKLVVWAIECAMQEAPKRVLTLHEAARQIGQGRYADIINKLAVRLEEKKSQDAQSRDEEDAYTFLKVKPISTDAHIAKAYVLAAPTGQKPVYLANLRLLAERRCSAALFKLADDHERGAMALNIDPSTLTEEEQLQYVMAMSQSNEGTNQDEWQSFPDANTSVARDSQLRAPNMPVGLKNIGNTCYINSFFQALAQLPKFRQLMFNLKLPALQIDSDKFLLEVQYLIAQLVLSEQRSVSPRAVFDRLKMKMTGGQEDVTEYMVTFLDQMDTSFTELEKRERDAAGVTTEHAAPVGLTSGPSPGPPLPPTPIKKMFYSTAVQRLFCKVASGQTYFEKDTLNELGLIVLDNMYHSLHDALDGFTMPNPCEYRPTVIPNATGGNYLGSKQLLFRELSPVLVFQLPRITYDTTLNTARKDTTEFTFDKNIFMDRYLEANWSLVESLRGGEEEAKTRIAALRAQVNTLRDFEGSGLSQGRILAMAQRILAQNGLAAAEIMEDITHNIETQTDTLSIDLAENERKARRIYDDSPDLQKRPYELYAMLIHSGGVTGGHYWSYVRDFAGNRWLKFNDSDVSLVVDEDEMMQDARGRPNGTAGYCLIYIASAESAAATAEDLTALRASIPQNLRDHVYGVGGAPSTSINASSAAAAIQSERTPVYNGIA